MESLQRIIDLSFLQTFTKGDYQKISYNIGFFKSAPDLIKGIKATSESKKY
jgi:hypothetical protein